MSIAYLTRTVLDVTELVKCFLNLPLLASVDLLFSSVFVLSWAAQCGGTIRMVDEILPSLYLHNTTSLQQHNNITTTATSLQQQQQHYNNMGLQDTILTPLYCWLRKQPNKS